MPKSLFEFAPIIEHWLAPPFWTMFQRTAELFSAGFPYSNIWEGSKNTFHSIWSEIHCILYFSGVIRQNKSNIPLQYEVINERFVQVLISRARIWYTKYPISCVKTSSSAIEPWIRTNHVRYIYMYHIWGLWDMNSFNTERIFCCSSIIFNQK